MRCPCCAVGSKRFNHPLWLNAFTSSSHSTTITAMNFMLLSITLFWCLLVSGAEIEDKWLDDRPYVVVNSVPKAKHGKFSRQAVYEIAQTILEYGFAIATGVPLYSDDVLSKAQDTIDSHLSDLKYQVALRGLHKKAPWLHPTKRTDFMYDEAYSYSPGRIDQPLTDYTPFNESHPDLKEVCKAVFGRKCGMLAGGALWNFPGSDVETGEIFWHRDANKNQKEAHAQLLHITAPRDYPARAGHMWIHPYSHEFGKHWNAESTAAPQAKEATPIHAVLKKGESLFLIYTTKHGVTPNPSFFERGLIYSTYKAGVCDRCEVDPNHSPEASITSNQPEYMDINECKAIVKGGCW